MIVLNKRWTVKPQPSAHDTSLQKELKINPILCNILLQRNITTYNEAFLFFRPELSHLHSPYLMKDMDKAVSRILNAIAHKQKILVYGDYDVDGTTAVALVYQFLAKHSQNVEYYIPHRFKEGYGVSEAGIAYAQENNFNLIIALDCGIKSVALVNKAAIVGIDFIICDHHTPGDEIPAAHAILNPKQDDCPYPYKELCGCGIGFKLVCALTEAMDLDIEEAHCYLDLVATAIAADIVPITGENRILAHFGIKRVNENPCAGIAALRELSAQPNAILEISNLVFIIAPRINAAGRMDDAKKAVQLFLAKDITEGKALAQILNTDNLERRDTDANISEQATEILTNDTELQNNNSIVLYQPDWHKGVVGIVAARMVDKFYKPTIVLTLSNGFISGSARSVSGFNVYEAINACSDLLVNYGGHFYAAGLTLLPQNLEAFKARFESIVTHNITEAQKVPELVIDAPFNFAELKSSLYNILAQMAPFGPNNMKPVFIAYRAYDNGFTKIVKDKHIRFQLYQKGSQTVHGIGFNLADKFHLVEENKALDVVFTIEQNDWNNQSKIEIRVLDIRQSD